MIKTAIMDPEEEPERKNCPSCGLYMMETDEDCLNCGDGRSGDLRFDLPTDLSLPTLPDVRVSYGTTTASASWVGTSNNGRVEEHSVEIVYDCSVQGHLITEYSVESVEGQVTGYCEHCGQRFKMCRFPGGINAVRVKTLIEAVTDEEWANPEAIILEHDYLTEALRDDVTSIRECLGLLDIARSMINERLGPK